MKPTVIGKTMVAASMALVLMIWSGQAAADQEFQTLAGVPAEALSHSELAAVEGKDALGIIFTAKAGGELLKAVRSKKNDPLLVIDLQGDRAIGILDPNDGLLVDLPSKTKNPLILLNLGPGFELGAR